MSKNFIVVVVLLLALGGVLIFSGVLNSPSVPQNQQVQNTATTTPPLPNEDICTNDKEILITSEEQGIRADNESQRMGSSQIILKYLNQCPKNPEVMNKIVIEDLEASYDQNTKTHFFLKKSDKKINLINWQKTADFENDGVQEIIVAALDALTKNNYSPSDFKGIFAVYKKNGQGYRLGYQITAASPYSLKTLEDLDQDGVVDLVITSVDCGAHTCYTNVHVVTQSSRKLQSQDLASVMSASSEDIKIEDIDNDGIKEITSHGGLVASAGAGMKQREATSIYRYNTSLRKYELSEKIYDPVEDNYFRMLDAYYALKKNNLDESQKNLNETLKNPKWQIFSNKFGIEAAEQTPENYAENISAQKISAFIYNEILLTHAAKYGGLSNLAIDITLNDMEKEFASKSAAQPYLEGARTFRDVLYSTKDYKQACQAMKNKIASYGSASEFFDWYGYNEEHLKPEDTCPFN